MLFREIQHQQRALSIIRRGLASGRAHHAYLLEGPAGIGKELAANALAAALLCDDATRAPEDDACGACRSCQLFASGNHPDFHLIHRGLHKQHPERNVRASKGLFLVVDLVRHFLIEPSSNSPSLGRRRVFVVRDAERMNEGAQNALLKTLEEPPGSVCLILVTSSADRLLPTIRSRCQRVPFDLLPAEFVRTQLTDRWELPDADAAALAALSGGRLGAALHWHRAGLMTAARQLSDLLTSNTLGSPEDFAKTLLEITSELASRSRDSQVDAASDDEPEIDDTPLNTKTSSRSIGADETRDALKLVLLVVAAIYRDALVARTDNAALRALPREVSAVERIAQRSSTDRLIDAIDSVAQTEQMLDRNVAPQLACEHLCIGLTVGASNAV